MIYNFETVLCYDSSLHKTESTKWRPRSTFHHVNAFCQRKIRPCTSGSLSTKQYRVCLTLPIANAFESIAGQRKMLETSIISHSNNFFFFFSYAPASIDRGHAVFGPSVFPCVGMFVRKNFFIGSIF